MEKAEKEIPFFIICVHSSKNCTAKIITVVVEFTMLTSHKIMKQKKSPTKIRLETKHVHTYLVERPLIYRIIDLGALPAIGAYSQIFFLCKYISKYCNLISGFIPRLAKLFAKI